MAARTTEVDGAPAALGDARPSTEHARPAAEAASDLRAALRSSTLELHRHLDQAPDQRALLARDLTLARYATIMAKHHRALAATEAVLAALEPCRPSDLTPYRPRRPALEDDLATLGTHVSSEWRPETLESPTVGAATATDAPNARGRYLGTRYVLEGSTLGAAAIARRLERHLPDLRANAFGYWRVQADEASGWQAFARTLAALPARGELASSAIAAAHDTFAAFLRAFGLDAPDRPRAAGDAGRERGS